MSRVYRYGHIGLITALLTAAVAFEASAVHNTAPVEQPAAQAYASDGTR